MIVPLLIRLRATIVGPGAWMTSFEHCVTTVVLAVSASSAVRNVLVITVAQRQSSSMFCRSSGISVIPRIPEKEYPKKLAPPKHKCYWLS